MQDIDSLTGKSILVVGPQALADHIKAFFLSERAPFSPGNFHCTENLEEAITLSKQEEQFGTILFSIEKENPASLAALKQLRDARRGPVIVMTDDDYAISTARQVGQAFFLPTDSGLTPRLFSDVVHAAWEHTQLHDANKKLQENYRESEQRFKDVAEQFADWLWEIDDKLQIVFSSSRKRAQGAEEGGTFASCFLPDEKTRIEDDFQLLFQEEKPFQDREYWSFDPYGTRLCWALSGTPVYDQTGRLKGFRGIGRDVSNQKSSADQLYYLSNNDSLTGLYNRTRFYDELGRSVRAAERGQSEGALLTIDVDRFHYVNETYGHEAGDRLLVHVAQIIKDNMRAVDFIARTGSNEFSLIMPEQSLQDLEYRVKALREAFDNKPLELERGTVTYSTSMGIVRFPEQGHNADELLSKMALTVNMARDRGRNRFEFYDDTKLQDENVKRSMEWLDFVARCLEEEQDRLVLHFQPIIPLNGHPKKDFFEVLVRLIDENGEIVSPVKFIETAEEFGMIGKIDQIVATRSIKLLQEWQAQGRDASLSVNISCRTFDDKEALAAMRNVVESTSIKPGSLVFEMTETTMLQDIQNVRNVIKDFKQFGIHFALDDCGVGYSSLNYIRQLDLDYVKIDGTFIRNMHKNESDGAFVKALSDVAKEMNMKTVAEMVENKEILDKLKEIGVDFAQGYYFAVPGPDAPERLD